MTDAQTTEVAPEFGYTRDRSFYASRPSNGPIKVHRDSAVVPGMAACDTVWILLYMESAWDVDKARREHPHMLCRRCYPPVLPGGGAS